MEPSSQPPKPVTGRGTFWQEGMVLLLEGLHTGGERDRRGPIFCNGGFGSLRGERQCNGTFGRIRSETPGGATSASIPTSSIGMWQDS